MQGTENYIQWTGDPYDADINVQMIYIADNIQFNDLKSPTIVGASTTKNYRGPVWVVATLKDKLMHPTINFELQLPPNSEIRNDANAYYTLLLINSEPSELNKQVAFLLVFNSFGPLSSSGVAYTANDAVSGIFVSSISSYISGALSNQFSNYFQRVFKDKSIRVNFNTALYNGTALEANGSTAPGSGSTSDYDRTNLNLSVIKSFLNERLTFTVGSALDFGITTQQAATAAVQFLPNFIAEWKLTENGRVVLTFFYRDSYNYLQVNHPINSSGTSISYRREFDSLDELLKKKKKTDSSENGSTKN